jgi:hypothetical protein
LERRSEVSDGILKACNRKKVATTEALGRIRLHSGMPKRKSVLNCFLTSARPPNSVHRGGEQINILLYNPDNEITNNFMPHLWIFLLKSLTPVHKVFLIDGNARPLTRLIAYCSIEL